MSVAAPRSIDLSVELPFSPAKVWSCFADPVAYARWYPPEASIEPGVGGQIESVWPGGFATVEPIVAWEPERKLVTQWEDPLDPDRVLEVAWTFEAISTGTRVGLCQSGFGTEDGVDGLIDGCERGWRYQLESLRHYLTHHDGQGRVVAFAGRPTRLDRPRAWAALAATFGFADLTADAGRADLVWSAGGFGGRVASFDPPRDLVLVRDGGDALLRLQVDLPIAPGTPHVVYLFASIWGGEPAEAEALERAWAVALEEALPR